MLNAAAVAAAVLMIAYSTGAMAKITFDSFHQQVGSVEPHFCAQNFADPSSFAGGQANI